MSLILPIESLKSYHLILMFKSLCGGAIQNIAASGNDLTMQIIDPPQTY